MDTLKPIAFTAVNSTLSSLLPALDQHGTEQRYLLEVGEIYLKFLLSQHGHLQLTVPYYSPEVMENLLCYLQYITILVKLSEKNHAYISGPVELFDYFAYQSADSYRRTKGSFSLSMQSASSESLHFSQQVSIRKDRFVPLFNPGAVENREYGIYQGFPIFAAIARSGLIEYPVLIDLDRDGILVLHNNMPQTGIPFLSEPVNSSVFDDHDQRDLIMESLIDRQIANTIAIRYPYHANIDPVVCREMAERSKLFELKMVKRFFYLDIPEQSLVLLPTLVSQNLGKLEQTLLDCYRVINTRHDAALYESITELRSAWLSSGLNSYQYPFPSRWLMLIHQGEPLQFYLNLISVDFPAIKGALRTILTEVITQVYALNWLEEHLQHQRDAVLLLPQIPNYPKIIQSANSYLAPCFKAVSQVTGELANKPGEKIVLLDPFNKLLICNGIFEQEKDLVEIVVPDFLFFAYQPFIQYYIARYIYEALTKGAGRHFNENIQQHEQDWMRLSSNLLTHARNAISQYSGIYQPRPIETEISLIEEEVQAHGLSRTELTEALSKSSSANIPQFIEVTTTAGKSYRFRPNAMVLVRVQGELIQIKASALQPGQHFAQSGQFTKQVDSEALSIKLSRISTRARNWKQHLLELSAARPNLYQELQAQGLSVKEGTFLADYLEPSQSNQAISLPRARKDWQIVAEALSIEDITGAWINHKGWSSASALRQAYAKVVKLVLEHYASELPESHHLVEKVQSILDIERGGAGGKLENRDAKAIIDAIAAHITFHEITNLNH